MTRKEMISLIMPVYNCERFIEKALRSVFGQTLPGECYEVIAINDGSTDKTLSLLKKYSDKVRVINQANQGLQEAKGDYVMRLDPDDYYDPELLSVTLGVLEGKPKYHCVYTDRYEVDLRNDTPVRVTVGENNVFDMVACGALFRREAFTRVGSYRNLLFEEYDFMLRFFDCGLRAYYWPKPLYYHVKHGSNMTSQKEYWEEGWKQLVALWGMDQLRQYVDLQARMRGASRFQPGEQV